MSQFDEKTNFEKLKIRQAIRNLIIDDITVYRAAVRYLNSLEEEVLIASLLEVARDRAEAVEIRRETMSQLRYYGHKDAQLVEPLLEMLKEQRYEIGKEIIGALAHIKDEKNRAVVPLLELIRDPQLGINVVIALGQLGDKRATEPLLSLLAQPPTEGFDLLLTIQALVELGARNKQLLTYLTGFLLDLEQGKFARHTSATLLGDLGDKQAVQPLLTVLNDYYPSVRESSALALARLGATEAIEPIIALLKDADAGVRSSAATALGILGDKRAIEPLTALLDDTARQNEVRNTAALAIAKISES